MSEDIEDKVLKSFKILIIIHENSWDNHDS